ncbi:uncharacterized protein LOC126816319 [Patella vulgata]|uniref:uncharacterized protein LOC126816319 n=1 Tax=Patella vulgata TaxID=6465 RepID=UPI00217FCB4F|nr:uncharacterized protein LOC126816319 [Patella vulgata]
MSTIHEHSETMSSLSSSPFSSYQRSFSEVSVEPDLHLDLSGPDLSNVSKELEEYVTQLKDSVGNMKNQTRTQNKYIIELTLKYESSLDTIVELNEKIRSLEKEVQDWRIKARSHELSSSMYEHDVNELKDTIVLLRRESIDFNQHHNDEPIVDSTERLELIKESPMKAKLGVKKGIIHKSTNDVSTQKKLHKSQVQKTNKQLNIKPNTANRDSILNPNKTLQKYGANFLKPEDIDAYKIRQRPIGGSTAMINIPIGAPMTLRNKNPKTLPALPKRPTFSKPSRSFPGRFPDGTPRLSSLVGEKKYNYRKTPKLSSTQPRSTDTIVKSITPERKPKTPFKSLLNRRPNT